MATGEDDEDDDVARTSRIPTGDADGEPDTSADEGATGHDSDHEDREGSSGRRA